MDEGFSGVVRLSNISDFIAPNLNCIIPLEKQTVKESLVNIRTKDGTEDKPTVKKAIKVSLNDCLACNGCITSAETVLVEEQSLTRLLEGISSAQLAVVTVSPQSVCSIAAKRSISSRDAAILISSYFRSKGVSYVLDSSFGRLFSLDAAFEEFLRSPRPLLASACPGFVCYAEKTHGPLLIPLISKIRSPQAVQGALMKDFLSRRLGVPPGSIYHASVMPCFDKKLEASRADFLVQGTTVRETDCVISTAELNAVLDEVSFPSISANDGFLGDLGRGFLIGNGDGSSGGYADHIVRRFMMQHGGQLQTSKVAKNMDVSEVSVEGTVRLRVARVYGFRNIQNLVRKLKTGKCNYDYIEVMACPSGCSNGGGQIRAETAEERDRLLTTVETEYGSIQGDASEQFSRVAEEWSLLNPSWRQLIYTEYHAVETNIVQNLQW